MTKTLLAASLAFAALSSAASAQDVHVRYSDLDLRSPTAVATLDRRIEQAIRTVCPPTWSIELSRKAVVERCRRGVAATVAPQRDRVLASIKVANLTALLVP